MNKISAFRRRERETRALSPSLACEQPSEKAAVCKAGRGVCRHFILDFPASKNVRNKTLLWKPPSLRILL